MNARPDFGPLVVEEVSASNRASLRDIDAWLGDRADATAFHRPAWSLAVAEGTGQRAHLLLARRGTQIRGWLPTTAIRSGLFGSALVSAGFGVDGGIIADDEAAAAALTDAAMALARRCGCQSVELRGGSRPASCWTEQSGKHAGFTRPLASSDEAELKAIPRKQRAEVRRALGNELQVAIGRGPADLAAHYAVYAESVRNLGTPVFPRKLFGAVLAAFGDDADILTVSHAGTPVASVLSLYHKGAVMPYWGGGTLAARALRANDLMYFALMRHARDRGCTRFDFGRSKVETGAYAFKRNWGFEPAPLTYWSWTPGGSTPRDVNPLSPRYRAKIALWKKLPLPVANLIGPMIARGLG